jgi:alkanesulfonate monooxygenase SsuD/methylene tetrahydromethanopterin reductase-like flavin-dependent oxidoreductase (luciferase family)
MRVGAGILLTALLNPVEVAESAATLDAITGGRFVLGVGLGYRVEEDHAFGLYQQRVGSFTEKLDVIRRLLEGETVTAEGHGFRLDAQSLAIRPVQRPRPPIWIAANSDAAVLRAARLADTWFANPHVTEAELARQLELFRAERGAPPTELPGMREVCIAATDKDALETARPYLDAKYKAYVQWGQSDVLPQSDTLRKDWQELRAGRFLIGDPDTVLAGLRRQSELGFTELVVRAQWPGMPHAQTMRTLAHLAELLPELT